MERSVLDRMRSAYLNSILLHNPENISGFECCCKRFSANTERSAQSMSVKARVYELHALVDPESFSALLHYFRFNVLPRGDYESLITTATILDIADVVKDAIDERTRQDGVRIRAFCNANLSRG